MTQADFDKILSRVQKEMSSTPVPLPKPDTNLQRGVASSNHVPLALQPAIQPQRQKPQSIPQTIPSRRTSQQIEMEKKLAAFQQEMIWIQCRICKSKNWVTREFNAHNDTCPCGRYGFLMQNRAVSEGNYEREQELRMLANVPALAMF